MSVFDIQQTVGEIVAQDPGLSSVFEGLGIDYCCRGKRTIAEACRQKGLDPQLVLTRLEDYTPVESSQAGSVDAAAMSLTALADHIEQTHHAYLRKELPRLATMTEEVASVHGAQDRRLDQVHDTFRTMAMELWAHMLKEEQCLFPMIRQLESSEALPKFHAASVAEPIRQMEFEHDGAGSALERLRELTDGFTPPSWACNTYRATLSALADLEQDMHIHIHKENNVLFPRALEMESQKRHGLPVT